MHSYQTLAVLALAVSTASPAISAPIPEQARAIVDDRGLSGILKTTGVGAALGSIPVIFEHLLDGNSTRRDLDERSSAARSLLSSLLSKLKTDDPLAKVLSNAALGGVATGGAAVATEDLLNNTRREPTLLDDVVEVFGKDIPVGKLFAAAGLGGTIGGIGTALGDSALPSKNHRREPNLLTDAVNFIGEDGISALKVLGAASSAGLLGGAAGKLGSNTANLFGRHSTREPNLLGIAAETLGENGLKVAKLLGTAITGGFFGGLGGKGTGLLTNTTSSRREPSPFDLEDTGVTFDTATGTVDPANTTDPADTTDGIESKIERLKGFGLELPPQDLTDSLQLLSRRLNELD